MRPGITTAEVIRVRKDGDEKRVTTVNRYQKEVDQ